jgi:polyisoprenoid-binding protein YceI
MIFLRFWVIFIRQICSSNQKNRVMMMKNFLKSVKILVLLLSLHSIGNAQVKYVLGTSPEFKVEGGSSLHDWDMSSNVAKGEGQFILEDNKFKDIQSLQVTMEAESLKSGTRGLDSNAYKALDTKKNKELKFTLRELVVNGDSYEAKGDFTIAGVTKAASFPVKVSQNGKKITFEGSYDTKLTHYSIDPPTALLGTVKTKDEITINFKTTFQPNN